MSIYLIFNNLYKSIIGKNEAIPPSGRHSEEGYQKLILRKVYFIVGKSSYQSLE